MQEDNSVSFSPTWGRLGYFQFFTVTCHAKKNTFGQLLEAVLPAESQPATGALTPRGKSASDLHPVDPNMQILSVVVTQHMVTLPSQGWRQNELL